MRILHAIHDFLPRHRAGSEIYAYQLAREQSSRHDVFVVAAEYDPSTPHGTLRWRMYDGITVIELVNNWEFRGFSESYSSPRLNAQLEHVLDATAPDVLHVHNLLNLSLDLPAIARARGIRTVATLHDYTLVCVSGGQRVHVAERHVCETIDPERCSRCFVQFPFAGQLAAARLTRGMAGRAIGQAAATLRRMAPGFTDAAARRVPRPPVEPADIRRRLAYAQHVFENIDLFVAPSQAIAGDFVRLGLDDARIEVSDYGFVPATPMPRKQREPGVPLRVGFVGTLVWHKGAHLLVEAARGLKGAFEIHVHGDETTFPSYVGDLRRLANGLPVTFHGGFDRESTALVYDNLDVLVVASLWPENSPLVIHEAFMHRVPVLAADVGGIGGLVVDGVNGLLYDAFSVDALRAALQRALDDPPLLDLMSAARTRVKAIAQDAREWDARYSRVTPASVSPSAAAPA